MDRPALELWAREVQSSGLRFDRHEDALDYVRQVVEDADNWKSLHLFDLPKCYEKGRVEIVARYSTFAGSGNYQLVFRRIPIGMEGCLAVVGKDLQEVDFNGVYICTQSEKSSMFGFAEGIERVENRIPSFVRVETADDSRDLRREILASFGYGVLKINGGLPEGKIDAGKGNVRPQDREGCANRLIQRAPKVVEGVGRDGNDGVWEIFGQPHLDKGKIGVRLRLDKLGIRLTVDKGLAARIKFGPVFPRAVDEDLWASERV
jgi:hypothetical protein